MRLRFMQMLRRSARSLLDSGLDPDVVDPSLLQRVRVVNGSLLVAIGFCAPLGAIYSHIATPRFATVLGLSALLWGGCLVFLRRWPRPDLASHAAVSVQWLACFACFWWFGGVPSPVMEWVIVMPIAAALVAGPRAAWASTAVAALATLGFWALPLLGIQPPDTLRPEYASVAPLLFRELALTVVALLLWIWMASQRDLERELKESLADARAQAQNVAIVLEASAIANASGGFQEGAERSIAQLCSLLEARAGRIWRRDRESGAPEVAAEYRGEGATGDAYEREFVRELFPAPFAPAAIDLGADLQRPHVLALQPIRIEGEIVGWIELHVGQSSRNERVLLELLELVADQLARVAERERSHHEMRELAYVDALSGLPNRHAFHEKLPGVLEQLREAGQEAGLLFIDLNGFKNVNDSLGHDAGDQLLRHVAARLRRAIRMSDHLWRFPVGMEPIARFGGDEFTVLAVDVAGTGGAEAVADRILSSLSEPVTLAGHELAIGASIGIAMFPADACDAKELIQRADQAMYRVKQRGLSGWERYQGEANLSRRRFELGEGLRRALEQGGLSLHYQPVLRASDGALVGAEALMRWRQAQLGEVEPAEFIPIAEATGLIVPLGRWAIDEICRQTAAWQPHLPEEFRLAVNVSARQLLSPLEDVLAEAVQHRGCDPKRLEIELTETALVVGSAKAEERLRRVVEMGVGVTLDDFGTGYSSLSLLKRFPISKVKIDRDFVQGLPSDPGDVAISLAIIGMAKSLGMTVVAEGVEDESQHEFLALRGCDALQGWLFGAPLPADEFARLWLNC